MAGALTRPSRKIIQSVRVGRGPDPEPFDHLGAVGLGVLPIEDQSTEPPVELDQFSVDGQRGSRPRRLNFRFTRSSRTA